MPPIGDQIAGVTSVTFTALEETSSVFARTERAAPGSTRAANSPTINRMAGKGAKIAIGVVGTLGVLVGGLLTAASLSWDKQRDVPMPAITASDDKADPLPERSTSKADQLGQVSQRERAVSGKI